MKNSLFHFHKETKETTDNMQNQDYKEYEHSDGYQNYGASQNDGDYQSYGQESAESYQESLNGMPPKSGSIRPSPKNIPHSLRKT